MPSAAQRVEAFRSKQPKLPLHPQEKRVLVVVAVHLVLLPWMLASTGWLAQLISLGLATVSLVLALIPRTYDGELAGGGPAYRTIPWIKLKSFPVFWIGLGLLAYVLVQALNPAWLYVWTSQNWWMVPIKHATWLPTGMSVPFERSNVWRGLVVYASILMMVCTIWIGLLRRLSMRILLCVLTINGLALGLLLAVQRVEGNHRIPWPLTEWTSYGLTASFIYENHAGEYFVMMTFGALALATWYYDHGRRTLKKSTPGAVLGLGALFLGGAVFFTLSRGASLCLGLAAFVYSLWIILWRRKQPSAVSNPAVTRIIGGAFLVFGLVAYHFLDFSEIYGRFTAMAVEREHATSVSSRLEAREAAKTMWSEHWMFGVGAGCFRHIFPNYVKKFPDIYEGGRLFWEHAHDDWLEIPIELGLVGSLILFGGAGWWIRVFIRERVVWHPLAMPLLIGCAQTLLHAWFDFPFQCPAILMTWCVYIAFVGRWLEAEGRGDRL